MDSIAKIFGLTRKNKLGFTLIELLVVIAIIGIISAIAVPMFMGQRTKAIRSEATTNLSVLFTLQEQYYAEYGRYAPYPDKNDPVSVDWAVHGHNTKPIDAYFPAFRPGDADALYFTYSLSSNNSGQGYYAIATGKDSGAASGLKIRLNEKNEFF